MKPTLLLLALASSALAGQPVLARITPAALAKIQQQSPMAGLESTPASATQVARPDNQSIIKGSIILHDGKNWTLVPKGAVLFMPDALKSRVDAKPVGTLLPWAGFLTKNISWLTTNETTFDQAAGNEALPAERAEFWAKQDKIVVAVHQNGPISVNVAKQSPTITQR